MRCARSGGRVWIGRGAVREQYGAGEAYWPVLEALDGLCREAEGKELITLLRQQAPTWLVQMPFVTQHRGAGRAASDGLLGSRGRGGCYGSWRRR